VTRRTTVKAGKRDTVATIARRYRLSPAQVADWNEVGASAAFKAGQQVVVFLPVKTGVRSTARVGAKQPAARAGARQTPSRSSAKAPPRKQKRR
jgi:membrane-bound lytic murein transglycosylase D